MGNFYVLRAPTGRPTEPGSGGHASTEGDAWKPSPIATRSERTRAVSLDVRPLSPVAPDLKWPRNHVQHREDLPRLVVAQVRHILLFVEEYRALCELRSWPYRVAEVLQAVIATARVGFDLVAKMRIENPHVDLHVAAEDESTCMRDLEQLLGALHVNRTPPEHELEHAMDALIMQCVKIDAVANEIRSTRRRLLRGPAG